MKSTRARSIVIYLLTAAFVLGLGLFAFRVFFHGQAWASSPINQHLSANGVLAGTIYDREGAVLAQTRDGERRYHEDYGVRCATLHTVGDDTLFISTAVQNAFRSELAGYNPVTGLGLSTAMGKGNDVHLTLDADLCRTAWAGLDGRNGAAAVYNYQTGEILCMVSTPTYDPADRPDIGDDESGQYEGVYLNNVLSSSFIPGSTFKIITSAAAIENIDDLYDRTFTCNGSVEIGGKTITCMHTHGEIGFREGMSQSCNVVFAELAAELGAEKMTTQAERMGFNRSFTVDTIPTQKSQYDVSGAGAGDIGWSGIGQYTDLVNPMHMLILMGAVANEGDPVNPYFIDRITDPLNIPTRQGKAKTGDRLLSADTARQLKEIMRYTVESNYGDDLFPGLTVCAKTGTGEVEGKDPNGWMVGFSIDEDCPLAFVVVVENGGYGISAAGPIASALMTQAAELVRK